MPLATSTSSRIAARVIHECPVKHEAVRNILVFVSAVIPKALASILTSFVIELAKPCNVRTLGRYKPVCYCRCCGVEWMVKCSRK